MNLSKNNFAFQRIGIIGGGQLCKMMCDAGKTQDYIFNVIDTSADACAKNIADNFIYTQQYNEESISKLFDLSDIITFDFENAPIDIIKQVANQYPQKKIIPSLNIISTAQHRIKEKTLANKNGLRTAKFLPVNNMADALNAGLILQYPFILKTCMGGYDGKGQWMIKNEEDLKHLVLKPNVEYIAEEKINFDKELSCIVFRNYNDDVSTMPIVENIHKEGILFMTIAPARIDNDSLEIIKNKCINFVRNINAYGTLAIELFLDKENNFYFNEMAPRPHNSGHFSINACNYSQFDMHLKSITNQHLPQVKILTPSVMLNILGQHISHINKALTNAYTYIHLYGKKENIHNRKMGHINFIGDDINYLIHYALNFYG